MPTPADSPEALVRGMCNTSCVPVATKALRATHSTNQQGNGEKRILISPRGWGKCWSAQCGNYKTANVNTCRLPRGKKDL